MATYRVQGPDGAVHRFEGPDDATPEQVTAFAQETFGAPAAADATQAPMPVTAGHRFGLPTMGDVKRQVGLSLRAPVQAGAELAGLVGDPIAAGYNLITGRNVELPSRGYERKLDEWFPKPETDVEKFVNRAATAGYGAMGTMGAAGAASPVTATGRGVQTALTVNPVGQVAGATTGAGAAELARQNDLPWWAQIGSALVTAPLGAKAANWTANEFASHAALRDAITRVGPTATKASILDQGARRIAQQVGANWDDLAESAKNGLRQQVEQSIRTGTPIDPVRAQRLLAFQQLGTQPTNAMLTRNPQDWAREDRLRSLPDDIGKPLNQAHENAGNAVRDVLTARGQPGNTATGRVIAGGLESVQDDLLRRRTAGYNAAMSAPEAAEGVPIDNLRRFLDTRQTRIATQPQYKTVLDELDRLSAGMPKVSQANYEELRKLNNSLRNPADPPSLDATNQIRTAIDNAFYSSGKSPVFEEARAAHQHYASMFKDQQMVEKLTSRVSNVDRKVPYSDVFDTLVRADPAALKQVKNTLIVGGQGQRWETMKARTMEELASSLNLAGSTENRGAAFLRKMDNLAEQLPVIFEPDELARLQAAKSVVENAMTAPRGTMKFSNPSGTAAQALGYASDLLRAGGGGLGAGANRIFAGLLGTMKEGAQKPWQRAEVRSLLSPTILGRGLLGGQPASTPLLTPGLFGLLYGGAATPGPDQR